MTHPAGTHSMHQPATPRADAGKYRPAANSYPGKLLVHMHAKAITSMRPGEVAALLGVEPQALTNLLHRLLGHGLLLKVGAGHGCSYQLPKQHIGQPPRVGPPRERQAPTVGERKTSAHPGVQRSAAEIEAGRRASQARAWAFAKALAGAGQRRQHTQPLTQPLESQHP